MTKILALVVTSLSFYFGAAMAAPVKSERNTAFVLGSLHREMLSHPGYSLREFIGAMESFKPDLILTEVRTDHPGPIQGSIDGGIEQSIVYAFGEEQKVPVVAVDWFTDTFLSQAMKEDEIKNPQMEKEVAPLNAKYQKAFEHSSFFVLNSKEIEDLIRAKYDLTRKFGQTTDRTRNEHICENIGNALKGVKSKRVLAVFGLDHKYYLDDCFNHHGAKVISPEDFTSAAQLQNAKISNALKNRALQNISASKSLLKKQLTEGTYKGAFKEHLKRKLETYDAWTTAVRAL